MELYIFRFKSIIHIVWTNSENNDEAIVNGQLSFFITACVCIFLRFIRDSSSPQGKFDKYEKKKQNRAFFQTKKFKSVCNIRYLIKYKEKWWKIYIKTNLIFSYYYLYVLQISISFVESYNLTCPSEAHWKTRARIRCNSISKYFCLYNNVEGVYLEGCLGPDWDRKGIQCYLIIKRM